MNSLYSTPPAFPMKPLGIGFNLKWASLTTAPSATSKGRICQEARRLNLAGFATNLAVTDPNIVQANNAAHSATGICCNYCGYRGHIKSQCHKCIAEEYNARHANHDQKPEGNRGRGRGRGYGRGRGRGQGLCLSHNLCWPAILLQSTAKDVPSAMRSSASTVPSSMASAGGSQIQPPTPSHSSPKYSILR